jgi:hypothetical protein
MEDLRMKKPEWDTDAYLDTLKANLAKAQKLIQEKLNPMIDIKTLTSADINRRVIYRNAEHAGPPEYAVLTGFDAKFLHIQLVGDTIITKAQPMEVKWPV